MTLLEVAPAPPRVSYRDMRSNAQAIVDEHVKEKVLAGIDLLNEKYGPNWVDKIDPNVLLLESGNNCVLGQLYGDYGTGLEQLGFDRYGYHRGDPYGFYVKDEEDDGDDWNRLTDAWLLTIGEGQRYGSWS